MKDIFISKDTSGGTVTLTTNSSQSHYGCPVLRIEADDIDGDFGPADLIDFRLIGEGIRPAADVVAVWAHQPTRTADEIEAACHFLSQWPDGPQIENRPID